MIFCATGGFLHCEKTSLEMYLGCSAENRVDLCHVRALAVHPPFPLAPPHHACVCCLQVPPPEWPRVTPRGLSAPRGTLMDLFLGSAPGTVSAWPLVDTQWIDDGWMDSGWVDDG